MTERGEERERERNKCVPHLSKKEYGKVWGREKGIKDGKEKNGPMKEREEEEARRRRGKGKKMLPSCAKKNERESEGEKKKKKEGKAPLR